MKTNITRDRSGIQLYVSQYRGESSSIAKRCLPPPPRKDRMNNVTKALSDVMRSSARGWARVRYNNICMFLYPWIFWKIEIKRK